MGPAEGASAEGMVGARPSMAAGSLSVFADPAGRRRIVVRRLAVGAGLLLCAYLVFAAIGLLGGPKAPLVPWPELQAQPRTGPVPGTHPGREQPSSPAEQVDQVAPALPAGSRSPRPSPTQRLAKRASPSRSPAPAPSRAPSSQPSPSPPPTPRPTLPLPG